MKNFSFALLIILFLPVSGISQVAINNTGNPADPSAMLDINAADKGVLIPRVSLSGVANNITPINNPAPGLMVYNAGGPLAPGLYIWDGMSWAVLATMDNVINAINGGDDSAFGEMFEFNDIGAYASITIPSSGTFVAWNSSTAGNLNGMTHASSALTTLEQGNYSVSFNGVVQVPSGGKNVEASLFVNGARQYDLTSRTWFKEGGKSQNIGFSGIIPLNENDEVSVRFTQNASGTVRIEIANLSLTKID